MTAPFPEDLPLGISAEQRSIKRPQAWEVWLFLATCAVLLLVVCLFNYAAMRSTRTGATVDDESRPADAAASPAQQDTLSIVAVPVTTPSIEEGVRELQEVTAQAEPVAATALEPAGTQPRPDATPAASASTAVDPQTPGEPTAATHPEPRNGAPALSPAPPEAPASLEHPEASLLQALGTAMTNPTDTVAPSRTATSPQSATTTGVPSKGSAGAESPSTSGPALYFASDIVLLSLLTQRQIEVYVQQGTQWSRVTLSGVTAAAPPDGNLYRLRADTVPDLLRRTLPAEAALDSRKWAVWLEPSIADAVQQSQSVAGEYDLVIERGGRVQLRPQASQPHTADPTATGASPG